MIKRLLTSLLVTGMAIAIGVMMPTAASADPNPAIVVTDVTIESADGGQATVGDTLTVSGSWDATDADPHEGDSFTIGLPPELGFAEPVPFQLLGEGGVVWGDCLTDPATNVATCTLTAAVEENPELVEGVFEFEVEAIASTEEEQVSFNLNGDDVLVPLPGGGGIDDGVVLPDEWDKSGEMNANNWSLSWTIELPGARMAGNDVISIAESLSDNHQLCEPSNLTVETVRGSTVVDVTEIVEVVPGADPQHFTYRLTAPEAGFDPNVTYRLTYDTCTPDGEIDPQGTQYTNEAEIDVWGETSGVIGVDNHPWFSDSVRKQGSVLGGGERNGTVAWTVEVSGDHLLGNDGFTLSEQLSGEHEVCEDGSTIGGLRVIERYGPSGQADVDVTSEFDISSSSSAAAFVAELTIASGSDFAFRPSDYRYLIQYTTCVTTDGLPEAGTVFGNEASVDGAIDGSEATVPGRAEGKSGNINTSSVTIDGVEYLPQTTLNWSITVPGENIADIGSALTVADTLTSSHVVCGDGEDIAARLGLRVEARDQIQGGGLSTVTLSDTATATLAGDEIEITIPQPELALPGGSSEVGFSREYQYVISYTTCTATGGMDAAGTTYGNAAEVAGSTYRQSITQNNSGSGTGTGVSRGSVAIEKLLADTAGAAFVPEGTTFTVHVSEIAPNGTVAVEYDLEVPLGGDPVSGPNSRGTGWTVALSEPTFPSVPGVIFGAPVFTESDGVTVSPDGRTAVADLVPGSNIGVSLTNSADLGSLEIVKIVDGPAAGLVDADREYAITAEVDTSALGADFPVQSERTLNITAGEPVLLEDLPIGATVSLTETLPEDDDVLTWSPAQISPESIEVLPEHASEPATITVTNTVERTVGTFTLSKSVTGDEEGNPAVPDGVTVTATWDEEGTPGELVLTLPTDGTPVPLGVDLLIGTEVTLTETSLADDAGIAWAAPVWSGTGVTLDGESALVTIGRDESAAVAVENHAATSVAGISLIKRVGGEAAGEVAPDVEFPVTVSWTDAAGIEQSRSILINGAEPTPLGEELPAGTALTITEGTRPSIDTVVWGSITISGDRVDDAGDGSATVIVSDQQSDVALVSILNEATWAPGTFSITKEVTGVRLDHPDVPESVTVMAEWVDEIGEQATELTVPTDGTPVAFGGELPHGTVVTLTETMPADAMSFAWEAPQWSGDAVATNEDGSATVTIGAGSLVEATLTNTAIASLGTLALAKDLTGAGAVDVPTGTVFPVTVSWTDLLGDVQSREAELIAGRSILVEDVPLGVDIEVREGETELPATLRWTGVAWSSDDASASIVADEDGPVAVVAVSGAAGTVVTVTLTNDFESQPAMPATGFGADGWIAAAVALSLLSAGALAIGLGRHRRGTTTP